MHNTKSVIFDFGGVLLDLDMEKTRQGFIGLGIAHFDQLFTLYKASSLFEDLETGRVEPTAFMEGIRKEAGRDVTNEAVVSAWNDMLGGFRTESLDFVRKLKQQMPVFLYSNTNIIHYECFIERLKQTTPYQGMDELFLKAYYSHEMGMRKPHADGYLKILTENRLEPATTLFVDDNKDNIRGAADVGLQTHLLLPDERIENVLASLIG
jgi:putative hydrolase of the HAD superfamily